jgi:hypothetical protein
MADCMYVLVFLTYAYLKCLLKDFVSFSCIEVSVFPLTKTGLGLSGLPFVVSEVMS